MLFIPHFYSHLINTSIQVQNNHLEPLYMSGNMINLSELSEKGFSFEILIPLCFCLQMLNNKMLKPINEICLQ